MHRIIFLLFAVLFCSCIQPNFLFAKEKRPVILISHPTRIFISGYLNLVKKKMLPRSKLVLLFHKRQKKRIRKIQQYLHRRHFYRYSIVRLKGYPKVPQHRQYRTKFKYNTIEDYDLFFSISKKPFLPESWKRIFKKLIQTTDAYFIPGGSNVPARYHNQRQFVEAISTTPIRTLYEYAFLRFLLYDENHYMQYKPNYLVVGFCYGHQLLNVALGGDLYQSIPIEVYKLSYINDIIKSHPDTIHRNYFLASNPPITKTYNGWFHKIVLHQKSNYFKKKKNIFVLSNHQQAIRKLAKDLKIIATSTDGKIIEIVQHEIYKNVLGLQGHLERKFGLDRLDEFPRNTRRFHAHFWKQISNSILINSSKR